MLLYVSQFGTSQLFEAALWLFRNCYSKRVENQKAVKESTIQAFVQENHLFDTIMMSFNHQQLVESLKLFSYQCNNENADRGVKGAYIDRVESYFSLSTKLDRKKISTTFDKALVKGILVKVNEANGLVVATQEAH